MTKLRAAGAFRFLIAQRRKDTKTSVALRAFVSLCEANS